MLHNELFDCSIKFKIPFPFATFSCLKMTLPKSLVNVFSIVRLPRFQNSKSLIFLTIKNLCCRNPILYAVSIHS